MELSYICTWADTKFNGETNGGCFELTGTTMDQGM